MKTRYQWVSLVIDSRGHYFIKYRSQEDSTRNKWGIFGYCLEDENGNKSQHKNNDDAVRMLVRVADWQEEIK